MKISADANTVLSGSRDSCVRVWDVREMGKGQETAVLHGLR